jgi:hypothetical protein
MAVRGGCSRECTREVIWLGHWITIGAGLGSNLDWLCLIEQLKEIASCVGVIKGDLRVQ